MSAPAPPGLFFGVKKLVINDGKFVQVGADYHVHGDVNTHIHNAPSPPSASFSSGDEHAKPSHSAPPFTEESRSQEINIFMEITMLDFPAYPSFEAMEKYARIILAEIDAGMYRDRGRPFRLNRFSPYVVKPGSDDYYSPPSEEKYVPSKPKTSLKSYVPPLDFETFENERKQLYLLPCMHGKHATPPSHAALSPRAALFIHVDHSGVE